MTARFTCTAEQVNAERVAIMSGIRARIDREHEMKAEGSKALADIVETLVSHAKSVSRLDGMTLAFIHHNPTLLHVGDDGTGERITYAQMFTSQRRGNQCFNEKAIPKVFTASRVLNGSYFTGVGNDDETLQGVILALANGAREGHEIQRGLRAHMMRGGKRVNYTSEGTQSSSSLRALEALGVVRKLTAKLWEIADAERFARLLEGARGIAYAAPADASDSPASDAESISDDMPALPAAASDDACNALPDDVAEHVASVLDTPALPAPPVMLCLPAPAPDAAQAEAAQADVASDAPAKRGKRGSKKAN